MGLCVYFLNLDKEGLTHFRVPGVKAVGDGEEVFQTGSCDSWHRPVLPLANQMERSSARETGTDSQQRTVEPLPGGFSVKAQAAFQPLLCRAERKRQIC